MTVEFFLILLTAAIFYLLINIIDYKYYGLLIAGNRVKFSACLPL